LAASYFSRSSVSGSFPSTGDDVACGLSPPGFDLAVVFDASGFGFSLMSLPSVFSGVPVAATCFFADRGPLPDFVFATGVGVEGAGVAFAVFGRKTRFQKPGGLGVVAAVGVATGMGRRLRAADFGAGVTPPSAEAFATGLTSPDFAPSTLAGVDS